ncbi:MAG: glutathione S-transferase N-terminal domain-containing protein, partial [Gammaproteobacteria bacterium]
MPTAAGQAPFLQIGIPLSYFSAKTRSYLLHKGIPFEERGPTLTEFAFTLQRHTGTRALPVLRTPEGAWLQDTSVSMITLV